MADAAQIDRKRAAQDSPSRENAGTDPKDTLAGLTARLGAYVLACLMAVVLAGPGIRFTVETYKAGEVAGSDVRAIRNFMATDVAATEAKRREAGEAVIPIYDFGPNAFDSALAAVKKSFGSAQTQEALANPADLAKFINKEWSVGISRALAQKLADEDERFEFENHLSETLEPYYRQGVVANRDMLVRESARGITVRNTVTGVERHVGDPRNAVDYDQARRELNSVRRREVSTLQELAKAFAGELIRPNLVHNAELTTKRRQEAMEAVAPALYQVKKGEVLVREGDRVTAEQERKLAAHAHEVGESGATWFDYLMLFSALFLITSVCLEFGRGNIRKARLSSKDLGFIAFTLLTMLFVQRFGGFLADRLANGGTALIFSLPMAAALITIRVVLNSETALVAALPFLAAASLGAGLETGYFFPLAVGSIFGAHVAGRACRRVEFLTIGLMTGLAQALASLLLIAYNGSSVSPQAWWLVGGAFAGGFLSGVAALGLVPLAEALFGYSTDMRLLELASLDHPLLRDLMIRAPGTYHHSMVTGTLVKAAAEAIGARAVLATVASYYHDIGKTGKAAYFIENQEVGKNPHDKLSPSMSALILTAHVKEGAELAEKYRLGKDITDIIRQHHGTALIRYFYQKAADAARPGIEEVWESEYRYPGPKPQTREAALVMLADAVEAAARTLPDPAPARIQGMVQNIINRIFADGQLDECDLALKDLHRIARSFTHILSGIHHQRVDYPLAAYKEKKDDGNTDPKRQPDGRSKRSDVGGEGEESLKRLGM